MGQVKLQKKHEILAFKSLYSYFTIRLVIKRIYLVKSLLF